MSLAGKTRKELYDLWKKRISIARDLHKEKIIRWADQIFPEYAGEMRSNLDTLERYTHIAQVFMAVEETIQPHLFFQNPVVSVKAKKPEWEKRESLVAAVINQEYSDIRSSGHGIELENELALLDARLVGFGATKTTYEVEGGFLEEPESNALNQLKNFFTGKIESERKIPVITKEKGHVTERVNPLKLFLDPFSDHITKQKFVIEVMDVTKDDLLKPRYEADQVRDLEPSSLLLPESRFQTKEEQIKYKDDPDFRGYRIYEIHDLENRVLHTISDGADDFLEFSKDYPIPEGSQYSFLWFLEKPNSVYPLPPVKFYRQRANEFSYVYTQVAEQIDKFLPKIVVNISQLTGPAKEKLKTGGLGSIIEAQTNSQGAVSVVNPQVQPDLFKYLGLLKDLLNLESGVSDYELFNPEERKATEAVIIQRGSRARKIKPQKRVRDFLRNQAHIIWQTLARNVSEENFIKVLGKEALEWWNDPETGKSGWTGEDLAGDYWFQIEIESMAPRDESQRRIQNTESLKTVLNPELKRSLKDEKKELLVGEIFEKFSSENLGIRDKTRILKDLSILSPEEEHDLWMQGIYPPLNPKENLMDHYQKHLRWINSQAFHFLPREIQEGALSHVESYSPLIQESFKKGEGSSGSIPRTSPGFEPAGTPGYSLPAESPSSPVRQAEAEETF